MNEVVKAIFEEEFMENLSAATAAFLLDEIVTSPVSFFPPLIFIVFSIFLILGFL